MALMAGGDDVAGEVHADAGIERRRRKVLVVGAVVVVVVLACTCVVWLRAWAQACDPASDAVAVDRSGEVPQRGGEPSRTGVVRVTPPRGELRQRWCVPVASLYFEDMPVADGRVFVQVGEGVGVAAAIDLATGTLVWENPTVLGELIAVAGGVVYWRTFTGVAALDAATGMARWEINGDETFESWRSDAALVGDRLFVTSGDPSGQRSWLRALDTRGGNTLWTTAFDQLTEGSASLAATSETVVLVTRRRDAQQFIGRDVIAVDASTGTEQWRLHHGDEVEQPIISGDLVLVPLDSYPGSPHLISVARSDGRQVWEHVFDTACVWFASQPVVVVGGLAIVSLDGIGEPCTHTVAIELQSGNERWTAAAMGKTVVSDNRVLGLTDQDEPELRGLDAASGRDVQTLATLPSGSGPLDSLQVVAGLVLYRSGDRLIGLG